MALDEITAAAVRDAMAECDQLQHEAFLEKYGFESTGSHVLRYAGAEYSPTAVMAAAHGMLPGNSPLGPDDFPAGERDAVERLRRLEFLVQPGRAPAWERDEVILVCDLVYHNGWNRGFPDDPAVIELSELLQQLPLHPQEKRDPRFRNVNGVAHKTADLHTNTPWYQGKPKNGGAVDKEVIRDFLEYPEEMQAAAKAIRDSIRYGSFEKSEPVEGAAGDESEAPEGRLLARKYFARERDPRLRDKKIKSVLAAGRDLSCEACGFDFEAVYGERGRGYIECHHILPLHASGATTTQLKDLALLCSNCHRMIHRGKEWLTPGRLRELIQQQRAD
ncbi:HNH endonuclease [Actinopolyspora alba]|uniref:HNH endonuclease n=1 Tax=Actinopolyspora alba TaxID=673379 RepID=UPI000B2B1942|nr:HNH endonuclease [Actinopolyspora alba]